MNVIDHHRLNATSEAVAVDVPGVGRTVIVLPTIPDNAPPDVREGIVRRRIVYLTDDHRCPCGATWTLPNRQQRRAGGTVTVTVEHEPGCPAADEQLEAAINHWRRPR